MKIQGLYDATYYIENNKPSIILISRNNNKEKIYTKIDTFRPYIYTTQGCYNRCKDIIQNKVIDIEPVKQKYIKDETKQIIKVTLKTPYDVYEVKQNLNETFESDILFVNRFLIDNITEIEPTVYRTSYFDIETTSSKGFPNYLMPSENIISIVNYDNYDDKYISWIWHSNYKTEQLYKIVNTINLEVRRFNTEKEMLEDYINYIDKIEPDYLLAWNIPFDIRYLVARCEELKLPIYKISPLWDKSYASKLKLIKWDKGTGIHSKRNFVSTVGEKHVQILGLKHFDLLLAYKAIVAQEHQSWKLDDIAEKELGIKKLRTHFEIGKTWETSPEFIEDYNFVDVFLIRELDKKLGILNRYNAIKDSVYLYDINDAFSSGRILDNYILKKFRDDYIFPSKVYDESRRLDVGGGFVRQPVPGIYHNVAVFDFSGFYPNLMKTFNLSGDVIKKEEIQQLDTTIDEVQDVTELQGKMYDYNPDTQLIKYKIRTDKFKADLTYSFKEPGVMAISVERLMQLREEAKKEMKKYKYGTIEYEQLHRAQFSYKFIINAAYGTSAYPGFRLFNNSNANAITAFARMMSKWISYRLKENGWEILSGDTDSLFIQMKNKNSRITMLEHKEELENINKIVNKSIEEFVLKFLPEEFAVKHTLKMDTEKIYGSLLLLDTKKRYIGILKFLEGQEIEKEHYMGIDSKKSNTIEISKQAQLDLARALLKGEDYIKIFEKYFHDVKNLNDVNLFKISSKLEKNQDKYKVRTPPVKGSLWSNGHLKTKFRGGTKFYLLYVTPTNTVDTTVLAFEEEKQLEKLDIIIDREKYIKDLYNKFINICRGLPEVFACCNEYYDKYKTKKTRKTKKQKEETFEEKVKELQLWK
jgi:DNA polymerase elongation subunit (family B)